MMVIFVMFNTYADFAAGFGGGNHLRGQFKAYEVHGRGFVWCFPP
jgi:hypothetical protein